MTYTRKNKGVCSSKTSVTIEGGAIEEVKVTGGCNGNLKAVCALLKGRTPQEGIAVLSGIVCEGKRTSCPAQIALCLQEAIQEQQEQ